MVHVSETINKLTPHHKCWRNRLCFLSHPHQAPARHFPKQNLLVACCNKQQKATIKNNLTGYISFFQREKKIFQFSGTIHIDFVVHNLTYQCCAVALCFQHHLLFIGHATHAQIIISNIINISI